MKLRLILFSLMISAALFAQRASDGENYFNNKQYAKARDVYESLLKQRPNDALYNYRAARCYYELKENEKAILHFEMSGNKYALRDLYLGELYFNDYQFDKSIMAYQTYMATLKPNDEKIPQIENAIKKAEIGARLINKVEDIAIVDSIIVDKSNFLKAYKIGSELGSIKSDPIKLGTKKITEKITYSTQRQDRIYASDSIKGQMDLFTSYKLLDEWSPVVPLSKGINTPSNENYPFLSLDGVTLYFASDSENSLGGYDIFITRFNPSNSGFLPPENLGMPFNSPANDYMLVIDEIHKLGWFATDRNQPVGKVAVYTFVPNDMKTIIRSEDKDYIRQAAKLLKYRKSKKTVIVGPVQKTETTNDSENQIKFVVNDSVVYNQLKDFKSPNGAEKWSEINQTKEKIRSGMVQLKNLREQYINEMDDSKKALGTSILQLENEIVEYKKQLSQQILNLRNEENNLLAK